MNKCKCGLPFPSHLIEAAIEHFKSFVPKPEGCPVCNRGECACPEDSGETQYVGAVPSHLRVIPAPNPEDRGEKSACCGAEIVKEVDGGFSGYAPKATGRLLCSKCGNPSVPQKAISNRKRGFIYNYDGTRESHDESTAPQKELCGVIWLAADGSKCANPKPCFIHAPQKEKNEKAAEYIKEHFGRAIERLGEDPAPPSGKEWERESDDLFDSYWRPEETPKGSAQDIKDFIRRKKQEWEQEAEERGYKKGLKENVIKMDEWFAKEIAEGSDAASKAIREVLWKNSRAAVLKEIEESVKGWVSNYPSDIFSPPWEGWQKDVDGLAIEKGKRIDKISAEYGRRAEKIWKENILSLLKDKQTE